jgi:hypothetical protein
MPPRPPGSTLAATGGNRVRALLRGGGSGRRLLLLGVAGFLSVSALLAVGILLFGRFGETEGRILATTALLAGFGVLALPGAVLVDLGRLPALAGAVLVLDAAAASLALVALWTDGGDALGRSFGTAMVLLLAAAQTAALAARRRAGDPRPVVLLFRASTALALCAACLAVAAIWAGVDGGALPRVFGSLVVLDLLAVALQPILARASAAPAPIHVRLTVESGEQVDLMLRAPDFAAAAAKAIREVEREGRRVHALER